MSVACQILEHKLRTAEKWLGIDDPFRWSRVESIAWNGPGLENAARVPGKRSGWLS
jgi:hypothetical protein